MFMVHREVPLHFHVHIKCQVYTNYNCRSTEAFLTGNTREMSGKLIREDKKSLDRRDNVKEHLDLKEKYHKYQKYFVFHRLHFEKSHNFIFRWLLWWSDRATVPR